MSIVVPPLLSRVSVPARAAATGALCVAATLAVLALTGGSVGAALAAGLLATTIMAFMAARHQRRVQVRLNALCTSIDDLLGHDGASAAPAARPRAELDAALTHLEGELRAIARAYRNLEVERERAQRVLERQSEDHAAFFARLSHELRSPLNAILGYTSLLIDQTADTDSDHLVPDLARIRAAGKDLLTLIENLLDVGGEQAGRPGLERAPFVLADLFADIADEYRQRASGAPLSITTQGGQQTMFGNRKRVQRAVASLFDEALRARGMDVITLSGDAAVDAQQTARIRISGSRSADASIPQRGGSGVGLQAARALAGAIGGRLEVEEGDYDCVVYTLLVPLDTRFATAAASALPQGSPREPALPLDPGTPGLSKTALVIDDDPSAIDLLSRWLHRAGYSVFSAVSADAGLAIARSKLPDIILLDGLMPGRSGYDILPEMRAHPSLAATPIIIVTVDDDRRRGLDAGASDYVRKPVTEAELRRLVSTWEGDESGEVLIIEDDDDAADLLVRNVRRMGFTARRASDGAEGLAALRQTTPRAIMLDLNMPNLDGFDFIKELSHDARFAQTPLIVVSGQDLSAQQHSTLLSAGCRFYLKGNATPREIAAGLREALA